MNATSQRLPDSLGTLARGTAINLGGSLYNLLGRLIFNLLVARLLGPSLLGVYFVALTVGSALGVVAVAGFDTTLVRYLARSRAAQDWGSHRGILRFVLRAASLVGLVGFAIFLLAARWLAVGVFHNAALVAPIRLMALYGPLVALETLLLAATQSFKEMKYKVWIDSILNPTLRIAVVAGALLFGGGLRTVLIGYLLVTLICALLARIALHRCQPADLSRYVPSVDRGELLRYSVPVLGANIVIFLLLFGNSLILAHYFPAQEVGQYFVCLRLMLLSGVALSAVSQIFAPMIAELQQSGETAKLERYFRVVTLWVVEAYMPVLLLFLILPRQVLALFGRGFAEAAPALVMLAVAQLANMLTGPVGLVLNMTGWTRLELRNSATVLLLQLSLGFLLIPRIGLRGAALADGLALTAVNLVRVVQLRRRIRIHPFSLTLGKPLLAGLVAWGAAVPWFQHMVPTGHLRLALLFIAMLCAYAGMLTVLGLDQYSRIAWHQFRDSLAQRMARPFATFSPEKDI